MRVVDHDGPVQDLEEAAHARYFGLLLRCFLRRQHQAALLDLVQFDIGKATIIVPGRQFQGHCESLHDKASLLIVFATVLVWEAGRRSKKLPTNGSRPSGLL